MRGVFVCNFGLKKGVQTYRINGSFSDLQFILDEIFKDDVSLEEYPEIEKLRLGLCTMLLKIRVREGVDRLEHGT